MHTMPWWGVFVFTHKMEALVLYTLVCELRPILKQRIDVWQAKRQQGLHPDQRRNCQACNYKKTIKERSFFTASLCL